jgi:histidyl-tRNA synthetase
MTKPSIPQGTRDFGPDTVRKRNFIFSTIRESFELYGFQPLETPAMENLETLMGKYGDEGDKLIFKILNNGLGDPKNIGKARAAFEQILLGRNDKGLTERALRYDLTIPFARYVAMNHGQLVFPFKRYQIQPVWRADRPQRGRYREFYQCDADVVGSASLVNEAELAAIYSDVFRCLGVGVDIRINNRKLLAALAQVCGGLDKMTDITIAIDKLDKIGLERVKEELRGRLLGDTQIAIIEKYLSIEGSNTEKLAQVGALFAGNSMAAKGIEELFFLLEYGQINEGDKKVARIAPISTDSENFNPHSSLSIDLTLARGLNYYTGIIFEVKALGAQMGSIGGGGRYDDLTGLFGVPNIPGVGISFGVDRIYDVMEELDLFPKTIAEGTKVLFFNLGVAESRMAWSLMQELRRSGIACELYPEHSKIDKQFKYAEKKNIHYVVIIGSDELAREICKVKDIRNGVQTETRFDDLYAAIRQ